MGVLKFKKNGIEFEYIGEPLEIEQLVQRLTTIASLNTPAQQHFPLLSEPLVQAKNKQSPTRVRPSITRPLPSNEDVKRYILSKPDYEHDITDIQRHFFGTNFKSRGETGVMYHRTARQVIEVRALIEKEQDGEFVPFPIEKNLMKYVFKKHAMPTEANRTTK